MKKKILIVDDDRVIVDVMAKTLEMNDREIIKAYDGESAYEIILDAQPDIVITDLRMPGMSGWELFEKTKKTNPDTIFIFVTGYGNIPDAAESIKRGVFDYLEKPFSTQKLKLSVKSAIEYCNIARENQELKKRLMYITEQVDEFQDLVLSPYKMREVSNFGLIVGKVESEKELYRLLLRSAIEVTGSKKATIYTYNAAEEKISLEFLDTVEKGSGKVVTNLYGGKIDGECGEEYGAEEGGIAEDCHTMCIQVQDMYPVWGILYLEGKVNGEKYNIEDFLHVSILSKKVARRLNEILYKKRSRVFLEDSEKVRSEYERLRTRKRVADEGLSISTLVIDRDFNILDMSQGYRDRFGTAASSIGESFFKEPLWNSLDAVTQESLVNAIRGNSPFVWKGKVPLKNSRDACSIRLQIIPTEALLSGNKLEDRFYFIVIEDLTEIEKIKKELTILENLITLETFSASVAHDLNNLIDGLNRLLQVLEKQVGSLINAEYFKMIYSTINKIEATIALLQEEAWSERLKEHRLPLERLLEEAIFLMSSRFSEKKITIKKHYEMGFQDISVPADVYNVFINIMKNAYEAMGTNGNLDIWIKQNDDPCYVDVIFEDDGCGVPDDLLELLGKPFFTTKENGAGLGLVLCEKTLRKYKGWLDITPRDSKGTRVTVSFPKAIN